MLGDTGIGVISFQIEKHFSAVEDPQRLKARPLPALKLVKGF